MKILLVLLLLPFSALAEFKSEDSVSINLTGGNTELDTYNLSSKNSYKFKEHSIDFNALYNYGESSGVTVSENWTIGAQYNYPLSKKLDLYIGESVESDRYAGLRRRYNTDLGLKVKIIKTEKTHLNSEIGYRYSIEKYVDKTVADKKSSKGRIFIDGGKEIKKGMTGKMTVEYLHNFSDTDDFILNIEPSMVLTLTSTFSMKTAYIWKYDNQPVPGNKKQDYNFALSLIANF